MMPVMVAFTQSHQRNKKIVNGKNVFVNWLCSPEMTKWVYKPSGVQDLNISVATNK
jgi:hypothetical protein